jgi:virginiamycin B lyase
MAAAVLFSVAPGPAVAAQAAGSAALAGEVRSREEGPMEGVMVSANKAGSTITITVGTDQYGRYSFPRTRLDPGQYTLSIRAVGYDAENPGTLEITPQKTVKADIRLHPTQDLATQLSNAEWIMSMPGDEARKRAMFTDGRLLSCEGCHTLQRIVRSHHDTAEWMQVMQRMSNYASGSSPLFPQIGRWEEDRPNPERFRKQAEFLSTVNLSAVSKWEYPLQTLPRPTGKSTHVIITEYQLPRELTQPHDVIVDSDGMVWYSDFGQQFMGKLDPRTGRATEYSVPELRHGFPVGGLDMESDQDGNIWLSLMEQGGVARFDRKTGQFQMFRVPAHPNSDSLHISMLMPTASHVDGKVWLKDDAAGITVNRLDLATGKIESMHPYGDNPGRKHSAYGLAADSQNNLFLLDTVGSTIVKVDAKTGEVKMYPTPTKNAFPRRGRMDSQDRLWVAEFQVDQVAMFDTRTAQFQEWPLPKPWSSPYDAMVDKNGDVWTGGMANDRVVRVDSRTGKSTEYLLPHETNIRRVFVDNSTTPVTFWAGDDHHHSIFKVEPLD